MKRGLASTSEMIDEQRGVTMTARALYDGLAADYDRHLLHACHYQTPYVLARILTGLASPKRRWLDLGAGTGLVGRLSHQAGVRARFVALDTSRAMLAKVPREAYDLICRADALAPLPFAGQSFAGVVCAGVLEHIITPTDLLANAKSVLAPGGWLLITFCPNDTGKTGIFDHTACLLTHDVQAMTSSMGDAGFDTIDAVEFAAYTNGETTWIPHRLMLARRRL